ncbi:MAG: cobalt-precorrin 5A hydrolase [Dissulfuribacterales bacterium]
MTATSATDSGSNPLFIIALTPNGMALAKRLGNLLRGAGKLVTVWVPQDMLASDESHIPMTKGFHRLSSIMKQAFDAKNDLICIMATGIVVRSIAPFLKRKDRDPAVLVLDEAGRFVISLLSGHLGGANTLATEIAELLNALPVITTASDVNRLPSMDVLAQREGLVIEDIKIVKRVQSAILRHKPVCVVDERGCLAPYLQPYCLDNLHISTTFPAPIPEIGVYVGCRTLSALKNWLLLRPKELIVGLGCNRGTRAEEIKAAIEAVFRQFELSLLCIKGLASIDAKQDETGLLKAADIMKVEIVWYSREQLKDIETPNPSSIVKRHMGVASVCEAAALLTAQNAGYKNPQLMIPKQKMGNVTVAVASTCSIS